MKKKNSNFIKKKPEILNQVKYNYFVIYYVLLIKCSEWIYYLIGMTLIAYRSNIIFNKINQGS